MVANISHWLEVFKQCKLHGLCLRSPSSLRLYISRMPSRRPPTENGRRHAAATTTTTTTTRNTSTPSIHLLSLPLELRESIFSFLVVEESSETLLNLILVNRQLYKEAKPFLFKRPLLFEGQSELFIWLDSVNPSDLRHVADLTIQLHDIRPDEIVGALGKRLRQADRARLDGGSQGPSTRDNPYHEACELEVKRIGEAFSLMPNVRKLSIFPCTEADPRPSHRMLIQFSKMLARSFPKLETLFSKEKSLPINFVTNKPRLNRLQIPSFCSSSCAETAAVFSSLSINRLAFYGASSAPTTSSVPHTEVVADALRAVRPLQELTLYESDVKLLSRDVAHELFVRSPDAIGKHLQSLRSLKILVEYTPEIPRASITLNNLRKFLLASHVERLEMAEPLVFTLDHRLPRSVSTYVIRLDRPDSSGDLSERFENLVERFEHLTNNLFCCGENQLPNLKEIVIVLDSEEDQEEIEESEEKLVQARGLFTGTNIKLRWTLADCHPSL